jgi:hypothetical protein
MEEYERPNNNENWSQDMAQKSRSFLISSACSAHLRHSTVLWDRALSIDQSSIILIFQDPGPSCYDALNILHVYVFRERSLELHMMIHFFYLRGRSRVNCRSEMTEASGQGVVALSPIFRCYLAFGATKRTFDDGHGPWKILNPSILAHAQEILEVEPCGLAHDIAERPDEPRDIALHCMTDEIGWKKLKFRWVASDSWDENRIKHLSMSSEILEALKQDPRKWKNRMTKYDSWI